MDSIQINEKSQTRYQDAHLEVDFGRGLAALDAPAFQRAGRGWRADGAR